MEALVCFGTVLNSRLSVQDLFQSAPGGSPTLDDIGDPAESDEGPVNSLEKKDEARELAD